MHVHMSIHKYIQIHHTHAHTGNPIIYNLKLEGVVFISQANEETYFMSSKNLKIKDFQKQRVKWYLPKSEVDGLETFYSKDIKFEHEE